ncbi:protein FAM169B isoform X1 [Arapaima gigas]
METAAASSPLAECYPVDVPDVDFLALRKSAEKYLSKLESDPPSKKDSVLLPDGEEVEVTQANARLLSLFGGDDPAHAMLVLRRPGLRDQMQVVALYLRGKWWPVNDTLKTANASRSGLITVQCPAERLVLFVLSQIVFGTLERPLNEGTYFSPHPAKEIAKILWQDGEAVGFYTVKKKGGLCDGHTSQCYQLPVLDTLFVRRRWRRRGFALHILGDFCSSFSTEEAVGISCPVSASMYQVCRKYLVFHEAQRDRLYEVEAPGNWSQRRNVWLNLQLGSYPRTTLEQNMLQRKNEEEKTTVCQKDDAGGGPEPRRSPGDGGQQAPEHAGKRPRL